MEPSDVHEVLEKAELEGDLSDVFATDDRSQALKDFLATYKDLKDIEEPKYYWPTETDPRAPEVANWMRVNFDTVFPNIARNTENHLTK